MSSPLSGFNGVYVARIDYQDFQQRGNVRCVWFICGCV
jgi:hypothetical protein